MVVPEDGAPLQPPGGEVAEEQSPRLDPALNYCPVIGDLAASKKLGDVQREQAYRQLKTILDDVNEAYRDDVAASFLITRGDEFQGVLRSAGRLMTILRDVDEALPQVAVRFGVGIGRLTANLSMSVAYWGIDGPAFYEARDAIEAAKREKLRFAFRGFGYITDTLNTLAGVEAFIRSKWTGRQRRAIEMRRSGMKYDDIALDLGITKQAVSARLRAAGFNVYQYVVDEMTRLVGSALP